MFKKIINHSNFYVYLLAFFVGQCTFILKLVSVTKIIDELPLTSYPILMLGQGILFFIILNILKSISGKKNTLFYLLTGFLSAITVLLTFKKSYLSSIGIQQSIYLSSSIFILSSILIVALDISFKSISTSKISLLKSPHSLGTILLLHEIGTITSAFFTNFIVKINGHLLLTPFLISVCLFLILNIGENKQVKKTNSHEDKIKITNKLPFLPYLVALIMILFTLKQIQGFAVLLGIIKLKEKYSLDLITIFSSISMAQTAIILILLALSTFRKNSSTKWSKGFNTYFGVQTVSMILLALTSSPFLLVITGSVRKIIHRGYFNHSFGLLIASIPKKFQLLIRNIIEKYCQLTAFTVLAILSYLYVNNYIPEVVIWIVAAILSLIGLRVRKTLLAFLNKFHLQNLLNFKNSKEEDIPILVNSSYALANQEAASNHLTLLMIITQNPPILLKKALIFALGEMKAEKCQKVLRRMFLKEKREDIQLSIIGTLLKFDNDENTNFYKEVLIKLLSIDTQNEILKISILRSLMKHKANFVKSILHEQLLNHDSEFSLVNTINMLGELARVQPMIDLDEELPKYTEKNFPIDIRAAAFMAIYRLRPIDKDLSDFTQELYKQCKDEKYRQLFCQLASLTKHPEYVNKVSGVLKESLPTTNSELISLLRSEDDKSTLIFIEHLFKKDEEEKILLLSLFAHVGNKLIRYKVYDFIIKNHKDYLQTLIDLLRKTGREFDDDISMMSTEAYRLGIELEIDKISTLDY